VEDCGYSENLAVMCSLVALREQRSKEPRSHDMIKQVRL